MIQFKRNDSLINSDLLPPTGGSNFAFKVSFHFFFYNFSIISVFHVLCLKYQNIIYAFVTAG